MTISKGCINGMRVSYLLHYSGNRSLTFSQRYEARLMNLHRGDDWDAMCETTPATINGVHYDHPMICEDKVRTENVVLC